MIDVKVQFAKKLRREKRVRDGTTNHSDWKKQPIGKWIPITQLSLWQRFKIWVRANF